MNVYHNIVQGIALSLLVFAISIDAQENKTLLKRLKENAQKIEKRKAVVKTGQSHALEGLRSVCGAA